MGKLITNLVMEAKLSSNPEWSDTIKEAVEMFSCRYRGCQLREFWPLLNKDCLARRHEEQDPPYCISPENEKDQPCASHSADSLPASSFSVLFTSSTPTSPGLTEEKRGAANNKPDSDIIIF